MTYNKELADIWKELQGVKEGGVQVNVNLDSTNTELSSVNTKLASTIIKLDSIDTKLGNIYSRLGDIKTLIETNNSKQDSIISLLTQLFDK